MPAPAVVRTTQPTYRRYDVLERLLKQVEAVRAEILACRSSAIPMPPERRWELEESFEGLVAEAQSYWDKFTPEDRATVQRARAKVLGNRPVGTTAWMDQNLQRKPSLRRMMQREGVKVVQA